MSAKKLTPAEVRILTDLVLCAGVKVPFPTSHPDDRRILASLVDHGYIECRYAEPGPSPTGHPPVTAKATRTGVYRILNPGKL